MAYLIGIDCGGTHIVGQIWCTNRNTPNKTVIEGPGNIVLNEKEAIKNLIAVLDQLISYPYKDKIKLILIGIAGIETSRLDQNITEIIQKRYKISTQIISDAKLALLNGLAGKDGALVISGTGSVVYGKQNNHFLRIGGWGYLLGDEGSAYDISQNALKKIVNYADLQKKSLLTQSILSNLNVKDVSSAVAKFYTQNRKDNAQLALVIDNLAKHGNLEAILLLQERAQILAKQVLLLFKQFSHPQPTTIALSGSVLQYNEIFRQTLIDAVHNSISSVTFTNISTNNAHGVVYWEKWENIH